MVMLPSVFPGFGTHGSAQLRILQQNTHLLRNALNISLLNKSKVGVKVAVTGASASAAGLKATYKNVKKKDNPTRDEKNAAYLRLEGANVMMKTLAVLC